jgi:cytochrome c553
MSSLDRVLRTRIAIVALSGLLATPLMTQASVVDEQQAAYRASGAGPFSAQTGEQLWQQKVVNARDGQARSCTTCHGRDLQRVGKHAKTGKAIKPLSPAVNAERLTDAKKIRKWFRRNCKWTWGRECTAQEKGDLLSFIQGQ